MFPSFLLIPIFLAALNGAPAAASAPPLRPSERALLEQELDRVQPLARLQELATYSARQQELGGGFFGLLPDQLGAFANRESFLGTDRDEIIRILARQREENREALQALNPDYAKGFSGQPLSDFVATLPGETAVPVSPPVHLELTLDTSVPRAFFAALEDGKITQEEALAIAGLPANQAMLQHRRDLGYVPPPLPDTDSLARMIRMAGSPDPLDRLWCWVSSQNAFDYADLVQNEADFVAFLADIESHRDLLTGWVEKQVRPFCPAGTEVDATFALTVGWAIRGWVTPEMAGLNIEQTKDDWRFLLGTMVEETYHRAQLAIFPGEQDSRPRDFEAMVSADTGDPRLDQLYSLLAYTVAEGAANRVRGPLVDPGLAASADAGATLVERFVREVVRNGQEKAADALLSEGLKGNGPLYGLGWYLADLIVQEEGPSGLGQWQQRGPTAFILRAQAIAENRGGPRLSSSALAAIQELDQRL